MNWKLSLPEFPIPLYYFAKLNGLTPFSLKNKIFHSGTFLDKIYPVILATVYLLIAAILPSAMLKIEMAQGVKWVINFNFTIAHRISANVTIVIIIIKFVSNRAKVIDLLNKLRSLSNELKDFGIEENIGFFSKNAFVTTVVINCSVILAELLDATLISPWAITFSLIIKMRRIFELNCVLIFFQIMICIKKRFVLTNEKLYKVFAEVRQQRSPRKPKASRVFVISNTIDNSENVMDFESIRKVEKLHLEFCYVVDQTIGIFGAPLLLIILGRFISLTAVGYYIYCDVSNVENLGVEDLLNYRVFRNFVYLIKLLLLVWPLLAIAYASDTTCQEIFMFHLQLMNNPVTVRACGFFDLGYSHLYKIFCTVAAYLIIIIQFNTST